MYGIPAVNERQDIIEMVASVQVPPFTPKSGVRIEVNDAEAQARGNDGSIGMGYL